ncbi:YbaB/EbfC family nucleoid-associated protein [uncultured Victivallis sp.]|uniref:YbaB/EbfC family nucleoid-associated protein n=1 Tax=uncultured Victivallis sp. TaxID=354118 RepID=UPI0025F69C35|nr:YbaB/EbfC family nucleoid-associated protein [uncultured Victivallis sp.]
MFGNLGELAKMMSKAKDIQANLKKFKEEMPTMEFSASSPGCQVRVTVTGDFRVKEVNISDEALKDRAALEEQILVATNSALAAAKATAQEKMNEVTGGLGVNLPGIF